MIEFLSDYAWIVWLALILVFLIVEMMTLEFTFLMIALGSLGGLVSGLLGLPWWAQIVVAAILSLVLLAAVKPPLLRRLKRGGDPAPTLIDALIGMEGTVVKDFTAGEGQVKLAVGETWTARLAGPPASGAPASELPASEPQAGDRVTVASIEGATALVVPLKATDLKATEPKKGGDR